MKIQLVQLAQVTFAISVFFSNVFAITIKQNTVKRGNLDPVDDITIAPGAYYLIVNNELTSLLGAFDNQGKFYVIGEDGFTSSVTATGSSFKNSGQLDFDSSKSKAVATYNIATTGSFSNSGVMYLGISGGPISGTPFTVTSEDSWTNTGTMIFQRSYGPAAPLVIGQVNFDETHITNEGSICMSEVTWAPNTDITGSGCISLGAGSSLELNAEVYPFDDSQIINLDAPDSKLSIVGLALYLFDLPTYKVSGFGNGNTIEINLYFTSYTYDPTSGILTLSVSSSFDVEFDIGYGYTPELFSTKADGSNGAIISYNPPPPNKAPAVCYCEKNSPQIPTTTASSSSIKPSSTLSSTTPSSPSSSSSYAPPPSSSVPATKSAVPSVSGSNSSNTTSDRSRSSSSAATHSGNGSDSGSKTSGGSHSASSATAPDGNDGRSSKTSIGSRSASSAMTRSGNSSDFGSKTSGGSHFASSATISSGNGSDSLSKTSGGSQFSSSATTPSGNGSDSLSKTSGGSHSASSAMTPSGNGSDSLNKTACENGQISSNTSPVGNEAGANGPDKYHSGSSNTTSGGNSSVSLVTTSGKNDSDSSKTIPKGQDFNSSNTVAGSQGSSAKGSNSSSTAVGDRHGSGGEHSSISSVAAPGSENEGSNIPASASHTKGSKIPLSSTLSSIPIATTPNSSTVSIEFSSAPRSKMSIVMMILSLISFSL